MSRDSIAVIDLGSSKLTGLIASPDDSGEIVIEAIEIIPCKGLKKGQISDLEETARSIDSLARKLSEKVGREITKFYASVSGTHVEGTSVQGYKPIIPKNRSITHQDVMEVVNHSRSVLFPPDREQIQAIPREFRIDGQKNILKPVGMSGSKLEVVTYLVSAQTAQIQNIERAFSLTGKQLEQLVLSPLAAGVSVLTSEEIDTGAAVVDIGAGKTDLAIFSHGSLAYSSTIPVGSTLVTSDISKLLKTSPEEADRLKLEHGSAFAERVSEQETVQVKQLGQPLPRPMQRRVLCEIIESRMRELAVMLGQQIEKSGFKGLLPGGIVLTGGGAKLANLEAMMATVIPGTRFRVAEPDLGAKTDLSGIAVAVGIAQFVLQTRDDLEPINTPEKWQEKVKTFWSILSGR